MAKLFFITIFLIGAIMIGTIYLLPEWDRFGATRETVKKLDTISAELDDLADRRDVLFDSINAISADAVLYIESAIPQGPRSGELLVALESLAKANNLLLRNIDVSTSVVRERPKTGQPVPGSVSPAARAAKSFEDLPLRINITGSYESLKAFLTGLERSLRIIDISDISFGVGEVDIADYAIGARAYYQ